MFKDVQERDVGEQGAEIFLGNRTVAVEVEDVEDELGVVVEAVAEESHGSVDELRCLQVPVVIAVQEFEDALADETGQAQELRP